MSEFMSEVMAARMWFTITTVGLLLVACTTTAAADRVPVHSNSLNSTIERLVKLVADSQIKQDTKFDPPLSMYKQFGVYPSNIRLNFRGGPEETLLRRAFAVFDDNAFVTMWTSSILMEAGFSGAPFPTDQHLLDALQAVYTYHDKNRPPDSSLLSFWPQSLNTSTGVWYCEPKNLAALARDYAKDEKYFDEFFKILGLEKKWDKIRKFLDDMETITAAFSIPADFDDTFVNIGFGALLKRYSQLSSKPYLKWAENNPAITNIFDALKKYAYQPFSNNSDSNSIDPRTYFYLREFLNGASQPLALIPTWVQNLTEDKKMFKSKYSMPLNINNVDLTVSTNVIYGLTAAVLSDLQNPDQWFNDENLLMIYLNSSELIAWQIERNFSSRPDLALTYYPSVYSFLWFTARTANLLSSADSLPYSAMETVKNRLVDAMRQHATPMIMELAVTSGDESYFDGFLGDADTDVFGKPVVHGEDRIYSTAMAINALVYSWSVHNALVPETPLEVRRTTARACGWLEKNILSDKIELYNSFFSGSIKTQEQFPTSFPSNVQTFLNGTRLPPGFFRDNTIVAVSGIIPQAEYEQMLKQKNFGVDTPIDFHGFNLDSFPFWSSKPLTYASAILALTQCVILE